ncbi:fibrobacter succinogenes major paralogous domain-containing protein [bacterium]|nr:fibrobacter succinogenes major paralogous domain-containing protein [bacterium]
MSNSCATLALVLLLIFTSFAPACGQSGSSSGLAVDIDGNRYHTAQIGTQVWMTENLRVTRTCDGEPAVSYLPNNDSINVRIYGRLYDWHTAIRVVPKGWHLPTDDEWKILGEYLGDLGAAKLKDSLYWHTDKNATNETGFSARPAGYWNENGFDNRFGLTAVFWSSTQVDSHFVWSRTVSAKHDTLRRAPQHPQYGFSIRCIRDLN